MYSHLILNNNLSLYDLFSALAGTFYQQIEIIKKRHLS